jgi:ribosomal protein S18 acetylase RimI-like enzyme
VERIRRARPDEAAALAEIHVSARRAAMPCLPALHSEEETGAWFRDVVLARDDVYIAEVEGRVVGFLALGPELVEHLYVRPDFQRRGIGARLLARAKERRPRGFRLYVFQRNEEARAFYERHGLRLVALGDGSGNEEREPDALYEWRPVNPGSRVRESRRAAP